MAGGQARLHSTIDEPKRRASSGHLTSRRGADLPRQQEAPSDRESVNCGLCVVGRLVGKLEASARGVAAPGRGLQRAGVWHPQVQPSELPCDWTPWYILVYGSEGVSLGEAQHTVMSRCISSRKVGKGRRCRSTSGMAARIQQLEKVTGPAGLTHLCGTSHATQRCVAGYTQPNSCCCRSNPTITTISCQLVNRRESRRSWKRPVQYR